MLPASVLFAQGKGHGVEVRAVSATLVESEPGKIVSASFLVTNKTDREEDFIESLSLPENWQAVGPVTSLIIGPQETRVRIVGVLVSAGAPAGSYKLTYSVRSQRDYGIQDFDTVEVRVLHVSNLDLLLEEKPDSVIAGDEYEVKLRLVNRGNSETRVAIKAESTQHYPVSLEPLEASLPAGGTRIVAARVKTDEKIRRRLRDTLQIQAQTIEPENAKVTAGITVCVEIIPKLAGEPDLYHRLPAKIQLRGASNDDEAGFQTELSGAGSLDELGARSVDFLFRAPDIQEVTPFGQRDEYRLNYYTRHLDLLLGDQTYALSQLTDYYRYGRGMGVRLRRQDGVDAGAFFLENRWGPPEQNEAGIYLRKHFGDDFGLKLNFLEREQSASSKFSERMWSLEATAKPAKSTNLEVELATSDSGRDGGVDDEAYRIALNGMRRGASYSLGKIHAGPDYCGYYNDTDYTNGTVNLPLGGRLRGNLSFQKWEENLNRNSSQYSAPRETFYQAGLCYVLPSGANLSLDYNLFHRKDLLEPAEYNYDEGLYRLGYGRQFRKSSVQAYLHVGRRTDNLTDSTDHATRYSLFYHTSPSSRQSLSLYAQVGDTNSEESRLLVRSNTLGVSSNWRMADNLSLGLQYVMNGWDSDRRRRVNHLYLTTVYESPEDHFWTLRLRNLHCSIRDDETSVLVSYTIPWNIPVSKKKSVGVIKGRVYDAEEPGNPGIPRVVVTAAGAAAATNKEGEFVLASLPPGTCHVTVENSTIGLDRVTKEKLPILVEVKGGETTPVQIAFVRSARLYGKVAVFSYDTGNGKANGNGNHNGHSNGDDLFIEGSGERIQVKANGNGNGGNGSDKTASVEVGGVGNLLLELTNGTEILRRLTDNKGEFSFDDLRPSKWRLRVYEHNLPAFHYLEDPETEFELNPGDGVRTIVRVLPRLRPVKIIEQGSITSEK